MTDYLAGRRTDIDLPVTLRGNAEQHRVWKLLNTIPYGETVSYGEFAASLADGTTTQEVGQAVGRNPLSIVFPCHRVIGSNGQLTGYAGGLSASSFCSSLEEPCRGEGSEVVLMSRTNWHRRWTPATGTQSPLRSTTSAGACSPRLLTMAEAGKVKRLYPDDDLFRATIDMRQIPVRRR